MKRIWKRLAALAGAVVVLLVVGVVVLYLFLGAIVEKGVETIGPKMTQAPVTVESVNVSLLRGKMEINGMVIGNPEGFKSDSAFQLDKIKVILVPSSILSNRIRIREILIDGPRITYELGLRTSNIGQLKRNIDEFARKMATGQVDETEAKEVGEGKKVQIDEFLLTNARISMSATLLQGKAATLPLPKVHLRDIGKEKDGKSPSEVVADVFGVVSNSIGQVVEKARALIRETGKNATKAVTGGGAAAKKEASKLIDGVKGVFGTQK